MIAQQTDQQVQIARRTAYAINYCGGITNGILKVAKELRISESRLRAMAKFIQTKGEPIQFKRFR